MLLSCSGEGISSSWGYQQDIMRNVPHAWWYEQQPDTSKCDFPQFDQRFLETILHFKLSLLGCASNNGDIKSNNKSKWSWSLILRLVPSSIWCWKCIPTPVGKEAFKDIWAMHSELFDSYNGSLDKDGTFKPSTNQSVFHNPFENGLCCFCENQLMTFFGQN